MSCHRTHSLLWLAVVALVVAVLGACVQEPDPYYNDAAVNTSDGGFGGDSDAAAAYSDAAGPTPADAGPCDVGDAGSGDAGAIDAGPCADAGVPADAGPPPDAPEPM